MIILKKVYNYFKILALDITIYLLSILFALMYRYVFSKVLDTLSGSTWASGIALFFISHTYVSMYRYFANIVLYKKG